MPGTLITTYEPLLIPELSHWKTNSALALDFKHHAVKTAKLYVYCQNYL